MAASRSLHRMVRWGTSPRLRGPERALQSHECRGDMPSRYSQTEKSGGGPISIPMLQIGAKAWPQRKSPRWRWQTSPARRTKPATAIGEATASPSPHQLVRALPSNENKMSDGGRERASLGAEVWKSSEMWTHSGPPFAPSHG